MLELDRPRCGAEGLILSKWIAGSLARQLFITVVESINTVSKIIVGVEHSSKDRYQTTHHRQKWLLGTSSYLTGPLGIWADRPFFEFIDARTHRRAMVGRLTRKHSDVFLPSQSAAGYKEDLAAGRS